MGIVLKEFSEYRSATRININTIPFTISEDLYNATWTVVTIFTQSAKQEQSAPSKAYNSHAERVHSAAKRTVMENKKECNILMSYILQRWAAERAVSKKQL